MENKTYEEKVAEEEARHDCCDGYVYYDGRCGDGPIYIHTDGCREGKREKAEWDYWSKERR